MRPTATTLPYDVLREIFFRCLPDDPLNRPQPNLLDAPMLLCHVCSLWRALALSYASLWSHIYYGLPIVWEADGKPVVRDWKRLETDLELLRWWRKNQGTKAPFIRFQFGQESEYDYEGVAYSCLEDRVMKFFLEYMASAQYLDVGPFALPLFELDASTNGSRAAIRNLHTLIAHHDGAAFRKQIPFMGLLVRTLPLHIAPTIRRLAIHEGGLSTIFISSFTEWSGLTHLWMQNVAILPDVWFSLIRGTKNLECGFFDLHSAYPDGEVITISMSAATLPFLSTLSLAVHTGRDRNNTMVINLFLSVLVRNVHLPVLHDLTIFTDVDGDDLPGVIIEINMVLESTPELKKLTLGLNFTSFDRGGGMNWHAVEPLSAYAPSLTLLQLNMCYVYPGYYIDCAVSLEKWREILIPGRWIDPRSLTNGLRKIKVFVPNLEVNGPLVKAALRETLMLDRKKVDAIMLEMASEDAEEFMEGPMEWTTWSQC